MSMLDVGLLLDMTTCLFDSCYLLIDISKIYQGYTYDTTWTKRYPKNYSSITLGYYCIVVTENIQSNQIIRC